MKTRPRTIAGMVLGVLGILTAFTEFVLHWYAETRRPPQHYDVDPWVAFGGTILAFVGGALLDFTRAKEIANIVVSSGVTIIGALPFTGRRWTDRVAEKQMTPPATANDAKPSIPARSPAGDVLVTVPGASTDHPSEEHDG